MRADLSVFERRHILPILRPSQQPLARKSRAQAKPTRNALHRRPAQERPALRRSEVAYNNDRPSRPCHPHAFFQYQFRICDEGDHKLRQGAIKDGCAERQEVRNCIDKAAYECIWL